MSIPDPLRFHINYKKLWDILEEMRNLEGEPNEATSYHKLFDQLPTLFSRENLIDYHDFIIKDTTIGEENLEDYKKNLLEKLRSQCSTEAYCQVEQIIESL
jgi:hypothetical protein